MSKDPKGKDLFNELMSPFDAFFKEQPVKGFLQSIDKLFDHSFPFQSSFHVETTETDSEYRIVAKLPGVNKEQIGLEILDRYLTITVQSHEEIIQEDDKQKVYQSQRSWQKLSRTIPFLEPINEKQVKASFDNELLQITVPKMKRKQIYLD